MKSKILRFLSDEGLRARAMRGAALTLLEVGGSNVLRLISNMILTRLLFPEAFGLMAIMQVFLSGLHMFSDIGISTAILQNPRADEPRFLNTAWTLQIIRGVVLWIGACVLAWPVARAYDEPMLLWMMPVAGFTAVISGFNTTKLIEANRHLRLGRQTFLGLIWQAVGIVISGLLAWWLASVWALIWSGLLTALLNMVFMHLRMPGTPNRPHWDREIAREIMGFGRFIFLGTVASFFLNQSDKLILGAFVSMARLGIYNIGAFLGTAPLLLTHALASRVILPLYRMRPPGESAANRRHVLRARRLIVLVSLASTFPLAFGGPWLIDLLYDTRYSTAGIIVSLGALASVPQIVFASYGGMLLAHGDSRRHFLLVMITALLQVGFMLLGIWQLGVIGAVLAPGAAWLAAYPLISRGARLYDADDSLGEILLLALGLGVNGLACLLHAGAIRVWLS